MMQLNRAKFMVNGGIGYVLKPPPMCKGTETDRLQAHIQAQIHAYNQCLFRRIKTDVQIFVPLL